MKLLIVDDNDAMRSLIRCLVVDLAETILECADGSKALALYRDHLPDWVLMDIRMGQLNGIIATRQIRAAYPSARIVIVTDYDDLRLRDAARCAGASAYVIKDDLLALRNILVAQER